MSEYKNITAASHLISLGTTGARLSDPPATYIRILEALVDFRSYNQGWEETDQADFGKLLGDYDIFNIRTTNVVSSDKDVRVKTGFISQLGFTTELRLITDVGKELLNVSKDFQTNEFEISKESFIYLKQFLKYQQKEFEVLPFLSLIYSIVEFDNKLPIDFVTYVWASSQTKNELIENIKNYKNNPDYRETIYLSVLHSENTKIAEENISCFLNFHSFSDKDELNELLHVILPHGRGDKYKKKTITLFNDFYLYWQNKQTWSDDRKKKFIDTKLRSRYKDISSKKSSFYLETLFDETNLNKSSDWTRIVSFFENTPLIASEDEKSFVLNFHILYMYIKKLSLCEEYRDLNTRHLKLPDIFIFEEDKIKLDLVFWYLFKSVKSELLEVKPLVQSEYKVKLETNQNNLGDIYEFLTIDIAELSMQIESDFPEIKELGFQNFTIKKKEERLVKLVNSVFTKENIIKLFENIYPRNDEEIRKLIKSWYQEYEATIPTLFEYLLGIAFYWISEKQVNISDILKSGLDANLLPKTHTAGGQADVIVSCKEKDYLIEATLSENDGQRKMEAEPVPRHLAKHILEVNSNSLALFVAGQLDPNNLVVLRNYKFSTWYSSDKQSVESMDILPLSVSNMIYLLKHETNFDKLEKKFDVLLNSETKDGYKWYKNEVNKTFTNGD